MVPKRILRYLKGTNDYGLWYKKCDKFELKVYIVFDWVGKIDDRKSKSGVSFFLGRRLISLTRKKKIYFSIHSRG